MKNTFKTICATGALICGLMTPSSQAQTFTGASTPETIFPMPPLSFPIVPTSSPIPTFYQNRCGGSAYNNTTDAFGSDMDIYLWGFSFDLADGYNGAMAYRICPKGDTTTLYRGVSPVGGDITQIQVGMYRINSRVFTVAANYNSAAGVEIHSYELLPSTDGMIPTTGTGGIPPALQTISFTPRMLSQRVSMDSHDMNCFAIAWEQPGTGIFIRSYRVNTSGVLEQSSGPGSLTGLPELMIPGSFAGRFPDIAITHTPLGRIIQLAYLDTTTLEIKELGVDLDLMFTAPAISMEDSYTISSYSSNWDEFQLSIDAPDHFTPSTLRNSWSYTYYNNDNGKINLRICDASGFVPVTNTYTVNDGSMGNADITASGNAFPTITYNAAGTEMYVGWYTTYDPTTPLVNYPLYSYGANSKRYVAVKVNTGGAITSSGDYLEVSNNYANNYIGAGGFGRPGICFSKHNEGDKMLSVYTSHEETYRWTEPGYTTFAGLYYAEGGNCTLGGIPSGPSLTYSNAPNYFAYLTCTQQIDLSPGFESRVIYHKLNDWTAASFFAPTALKESVCPAKPVEIRNNPFGSNGMFQLKSLNNQEQMRIELLSPDGKMISGFNGNLDELNGKISGSALINSLPGGTYLLNIKRANGITEHQKVVKL